MVKVTHQDFIEKLKTKEVLDLLYLLVEAKTGKHLDILSKIPAKVVIEAEEAIKRLIQFSKTITNSEMC